MIIPLIVLAIVFLLIAVRQIGGFRLQIWHIMSFGAITVLITGQITPINALHAINLDVILFLFGMFVVGHALEESGYLSHLTFNIFKRAHSVNSLLFMMIFVFGIASAFLMNDTIAIIGTPVVLLLAKKHDISAKMLLLALCFAVTIGSVMSPIGNPQNLLIALDSGMENPFYTFFLYLLIPTMLCLLACYFILKIAYHKRFHLKKLSHVQERIKDKNLARLSKISLILLIALITVKIATVFLRLPVNIELTYIALSSALPIIIFSNKRIQVLKNIDWQTLIFFAAMFVLMASVWETGFFQSLISEFSIDVKSVPIIFGISVILSQFISNVPLVALYMPLLLGSSNKEMLSLAAGSTIAGNASILGAASNVIIIQNAEKKGESLTFMEFAKVGIPLTIICVAIYWIFI